MIRKVKLMLIAIFIATMLVMAFHMSEPQKLPPCNPICFPNSYDTSNPDCCCNKEDNE